MDNSTGGGEASDDPILRMLRNVFFLQHDLGFGDVLRRIVREHEDQWSMVIKLNAVFEAALIHVLMEEFGSGLEKQFKKMQQRARIEFALDAGLIRPGQRRFLSTLNETRNAFAHRVENLDRTLKDYAASLPDDGHRSSFYDGINSVGESDHPAPTLRKAAVDAPETVLIVSALSNLSSLHVAKMDRAHRRVQDRLAAEAFISLTQAAETLLRDAGISVPDVPEQASPGRGEA
jgi:hypothetical protein